MTPTKNFFPQHPSMSDKKLELPLITSNDKKANMSTNEEALIAAAVKLPDFWPHATQAWLLQIEAQFRISKITVSQTKFDLAVQKLNEATVCRLLDLLENPGDQPYEALKARLVQGFTKSTFQRLAEFEALPSLGDRRPTELLDSILSALNGIVHDTASCPLVRFAFLKRLPKSIRATLVSCDGLELRKLALKADETWSTCEATPDHSEPTVAAVQPSEARYYPDDRARRPRPQTPARRTPRSSSPSSPPGSSRFGGYCWYHHKFGTKATRCEGNCTWAGNDRAGGRRN